MKYNKLVRDNFPESVIKSGKTPVTHTADDREYGKKLDEKLREEVEEFLFARNETEYADILEVLEAIAAFRNLDTESIPAVKAEKAKKNGGFTRRIILDEVT